MLNQSNETIELICGSLQETRKLGKILAEETIKTKNKKAVIFGLKGDLGSGKTSLVQGFAGGLGIKEKILSPTFVLIKSFLVPQSKKNNAKFRNFFHIDCYRIGNSKEILNLEFDKIISNPENIVVIEWPEKIRKILPEKVLFLQFLFLGEKTRKITISD